MATCRGMKLDSHLATHTARNLEEIPDLSVGAETIKVLEDNTGANLCDLGQSKP